MKTFILLLVAVSSLWAQSTQVDLSTQARIALTAKVTAGVLKVTCGPNCIVNGYSFSHFAGTVSGVASGTYTAFVYADSGAVKFGYASGSAPSVCTSMTCTSGISAMPAGPNIFPIATVAVSSGTMGAVTDAHNSGVGQPDVIVAGSGISSSRAGSTVTLSNALVGGVSVVTGTTSTLTSASLYQLVRCSNGSGCTLTLPQAGSTSGFVTGSYFFVRAESGTLTISPTTSTVNGSSTATVSAGSGAMVWSDGTNYFTI